MIRLASTGFYIHPPERSSEGPLLLGPFCGRPACQTINPVKGKGVCADAFVSEETLVVADVHAYPGHIGEYCGSAAKDSELTHSAQPATPSRNLKW